MTETNIDRSSPKKSSALLLIASWLLVGIPAAWGVEQTVVKSIPLFKNSTAAGSTTAPATR